MDDQRPVCALLEYILSNAGYQTIAAYSGPSAIILAEHRSIDGALIDVQMPDMNGFETCERLQAQRYALGRPLKIWHMTGAPSDALANRSLELGTCGLLPKPFDYKALLARLEQELSAPYLPRLKYIHDYIAVGEVGLAAQQLAAINRKDAKDPAVLAASIQLERARRVERGHRSPIPPQRA